MPLPADRAARRRDQRLALTRRVTLWVAGGAATASLGLGTAFAHALPGHRAPAAGAGPGAATGSQPQGTQPQGTQPGSTQPGSTQPQGTQPQSSQPGGTKPQSSQLSQPAKAPAATPASPQAVSGGS